MAYNNTFRRKELKFLIDQKQRDKITDFISDFMTLDEYGLHTICNIYWDSGDFALIRRSIEKPDYKEKLRVRAYGSPIQAAFAELKKKYDGVVFKRRIEIPLSAAADYSSLVNFLSANGGQLENEILYAIRQRKLEPKIMIAYERKAFFGNNDKEFRLTLDSNIRSRTEGLDLNLGSDGGLLMDKNLYIMEVKAIGAIPLKLAHFLSAEKIYPTGFSKYGEIYKQSLAKNINFTGELINV